MCGKKNEHILNADLGSRLREVVRLYRIRHKLHSDVALIHVNKIKVPPVKTQNGQKTKLEQVYFLHVCQWKPAGERLISLNSSYFILYPVGGLVLQQDEG